MRWLGQTLCVELVPFSADAGAARGTELRRTCRVIESAGTAGCIGNGRTAAGAHDQVLVRGGDGVLDRAARLGGGECGGVRVCA